MVEGYVRIMGNNLTASFFGGTSLGIERFGGYSLYRHGDVVVRW